MLSKLLNEQTIRLDVDCADWQDCVKKSGVPLVESGDITQEYIQAVIDNINEVGPYVVITKGLAMPHATSKIGVNRTAMSFVRLKNPVEFGNEENDPVKYVFMLAALDGHTHVAAIQDLAEFLDDDNFYQTLENAKTPGDVIEYIKSNECDS